MGNAANTLIKRRHIHSEAQLLNYLPPLALLALQQITQIRGTARANLSAFGRESCNSFLILQYCIERIV